MEKPEITIDLKPQLEDYLIHEFKNDGTGAILLTERHDVGLFVNSMWNASNFPKPLRPMENPVKLILPITEDNHYVFTSKFIYVPAWKEAMLIKFIEADFRRMVRDYFCVGYEKKFHQKDIIESLLQHYGMKNNAINFDQIKKLDYRNRENFKKSVSYEIQTSICQ